MADISLLIQYMVSKVLVIFRRKENPFKHCPLDFAEHPYAFEKIDPVSKFIVLKVASESVVEVSHIELKQIARRYAPNAFQLLFSELHLFAKMLSSSDSFVKLRLFLFFCILFLHEDHDGSSQNVIKGTVLLVIKDYLPEAGFYYTYVRYDELEILLSFLLVDQRKKRDFHEKILSSHS